MGFSLSGGPYQFNRFDEFEALREAKAAEDGKSVGGNKPGQSTPAKMKAKVDAAAVKSRQESAKLKKGDKKQEAKQEKATSDNGAGLDEAMMAGPRKDAMQKKSHMARSGSDRATAFNIGTRGDKAGSDPEIKSRGGRADKRTGEGDRGMGNAAKRRMNEDELNNVETDNTVMENQMDPRMAMYSRALGIMGSHYSAAQMLDEKKKKDDDDKKGSSDKKADKDYDGDGEVESSKEEYFGSKDKAIKKAMAKEEVELTKEAVVEYLVAEGYANNEVSAEILHQHVSDEFLEEIEGRMIAEMGPAHPVETEQQAEAQKDRRAGKKNREGNKTAKNPGTEKGEGYNTAN